MALRMSRVPNRLFPIMRQTWKTKEVDTRQFWKPFSSYIKAAGKNLQISISLFKSKTPSQKWLCSFVLTWKKGPSLILGKNFSPTMFAANLKFLPYFCQISKFWIRNKKSLYRSNYPTNPLSWWPKYQCSFSNIFGLMAISIFWRRNGPKWFFSFFSPTHIGRQKVLGTKVLPYKGENPH